METLNILISFLILVSILSIIIGYVIQRYLEDTHSEFVISYNILMNIIELYKETILTNKITVLSLKYDLNPQSKTNSLKAFEIAKKELISESLKEIMKNYLSKKCLKSLIGKYGVDGLGLLILTHLKR